MADSVGHAFATDPDAMADAKKSAEDDTFSNPFPEFERLKAKARHLEHLAQGIMSNLESNAYGEAEHEVRHTALRTRAHRRQRLLVFWRADPPPQLRSFP